MKWTKMFEGHPRLEDDQKEFLVYCAEMRGGTISPRDEDRFYFVYKWRSGNKSWRDFPQDTIALAWCPLDKPEM